MKGNLKLKSKINNLTIFLKKVCGREEITYSCEIFKRKSMYEYVAICLFVKNKLKVRHKAYVGHISTFLTILKSPIAAAVFVLFAIHHAVNG